MDRGQPHNKINYLESVLKRLGRVDMTSSMTDDQQEMMKTLRWRHNECDSVSTHQPHDCLLNRLFRRRSKKTSKLRVTGLCVGNSPGTGEFPAQMASNAENVSIWWRHHDLKHLLWQPVSWTLLFGIPLGFAYTIIRRVLPQYFSWPKYHLSSTIIENHGFLIFTASKLSAS